MPSQDELIEVYKDESPRVLYFNGYLHGLSERMECCYSQYFAYGDTLNVELYDLEPHITSNCRIEDAISRVIKDRFVRSLDVKACWLSLTPPKKVLEKMVASSEVTIEYISDGGIYESLCIEAVGKYTFYTKEQHAEYKKQFHESVNEFFEFINDALVGIRTPLFQEAPRYSVKIHPDFYRHHTAFSWATHKMEAVVSNETCLLFIFGNDE